MAFEIDDKIISEFLHSLGPWNHHVIIGGGVALLIYKWYFGNLEGHPPIGTRDIDTLIPRKTPETSEKSIANHLCEAGFTPIFRDRNIPATEAYVKEIDGTEVEIEFLTDALVRKGKRKNVTLSGVVAQPLSYLSLSLKEFTPFQTSLGATGNVVSPGAWLFHKGLTFPRRKSKAKTCKDLYGMWYLASELGTFSNQAVNQLHFLALRHDKWHKTLKRNLTKWTDEATPSDWSLLEMQDPFGNLQKNRFEKTLRKITSNEVLFSNV